MSPDRGTVLTPRLECQPHDMDENSEPTEKNVFSSWTTKSEKNPEQPAAIRKPLAAAPRAKAVRLRPKAEDQTAHPEMCELIEIAVTILEIHRTGPTSTLAELLASSGLTEKAPFASLFVNFTFDGGTPPKTP